VDGLLLLFEFGVPFADHLSRAASRSRFPHHVELLDEIGSIFYSEAVCITTTKQTPGELKLLGTR